MMKDVTVGSLTISNDRPLTVIAGPCLLESAEHAQMIAGILKEVCREVGAGYIFKSSFDKANRTAVTSGRGPGLEAGLKMLESVREKVGVPVLTDIHLPDHCAEAASVVDVLQIPAFLCRQTDLLVAAGRTGAAVNVKKGQFLAPWDMAHAAAKIRSTGNENIMLTERGTAFGYNALVADMLSLPEMAKFRYPVFMDATHAVQSPSGNGACSGGRRELAPALARATVSLGIAGVFMETHEDPDRAPCDGPNMIVLQNMPKLLETLMAFDKLAKTEPFRL